MTTWTMEQVRHARGLRARAEVDAVDVERYGDDIRSAAASKMARSLIHMAHSFAIELCVDDFDVTWSDIDGEPWRVAADMRWRPSMRPVELRGGHLDGQRYNIKHIGEPLRVPRPAHPGDLTPAFADTYELVGWREDERVWVYEAR